MIIVELNSGMSMPMPPLETATIAKAYLQGSGWLSGRDLNTESTMNNFSRRDFLGSACAAVAVPSATIRDADLREETIAAPPNASQRLARSRRLRVQFTPGGHTSPLQMYAMF